MSKSITKSGKHTNTPAQTKARASNVSNHPLTSARQGTFSRRVVLFPVLSGPTVREFRRRYQLSASALAARLKHPLANKPNTLQSYSRSYVKRVESGALRPSTKFIRAFLELRAEYEKKPPPTEPKTISAITHHPIPDEVLEFEILAPLVRCAGCGKWFIPRTPTQRTHTAPPCQKLARQIANQKKKRRAKRK